MAVRHTPSGTAEPPTDAELLRKFLVGRDEAAMAAIVERHGPLVMGLCRGILRNEQDAADAFQSTFLVLLKNAATIGKPSSLSSWLHGVACRVALRARSQAALRRKRENEVAEMAPETHAQPDNSSDADTLRLIHEELLRLPEQLRVPLILCSLQGRSREEAAAQLGWTPGSVKGRLERGREMLYARLMKRGVALPSAAIAGLLAQQGAAVVPAALATSTVKALVLAAAGKSILGGIVSANAAALTKGVLISMKVAKAKTAALVAAGLLFVGGSSVVIVTTVRAMIAAQQPLPVANLPGGGQINFGQATGDVVMVGATTGQNLGLSQPRNPAIDQARESLKQLALAMHNYHDVHNAFPPAGTTGPDGQPLLSWRVLLLPYLGHTALYQKFNQDEPWNSPHNLALMDQMPSVYSGAVTNPGGTVPYNSGPTIPGDTVFQVFTGPGTLFPGKDGLGIRFITDGTSNTVMIVDAARPVPWTKPEDLVYDTQGPLPALGAIAPETFLMALADGSTRLVHRSVTDETMRALITVSGGEPLGNLSEGGSNVAASTGQMNVVTPQAIHIRAQQSTAQTEQAMASLKSLALAMHNYNGKYGALPPAATYGPDGKPLLSWRVALLPFAGHAELYAKFKQDEAWDSPHNLPLLEQMPAIYNSASVQSKPAGGTFFQVITGPGTLFSGKEGVKFQDITDGTSATLLIVDAANAVPWTKPADLVYDPSAPLPALGGILPEAFLIALADGSTQVLPRSVPEESLRPMMTAAGGEPVGP